MLPNTGFVLPKTSNQLPKADLRREITPWRALVWAYADECVAVATNVPDDHHLYVSNGLTQTTYGERLARGSINGALDAHEDAFTIDGWLYQACGGRDGLPPYHAIRAAAEKRTPIPAEIDVPAIECVPRLNEKGKPSLLYPLKGRNEAYLCEVTYQGYPQDKADEIRRRHRALYDLFCGVLGVMYKINLTKWRVLV